MRAAGPFNLIDRLDPEKDVDGDELGRTVNAIDDLNDRPHGERRAGTFDRNEAFAKIEDYQFTRNLKVDGKMNPKGPTAKRIAAEKHLHSRTEPRHVAIPIMAGVGPGQPNRAADVRAVANGLTLAGHRAVLPKADNPDAPDHAGEAAIRKQTIAAQRAHGETPDGVVKRGGPTQGLLGYLAAPHIAHLAGADPDSPKPFQPPVPATVGRTKLSRPSTIITFQQDDRTLPDPVEHEAAVGIILAQGRGGISGPAGGARIPHLNEQDFSARIFSAIPDKQRPKVPHNGDLDKIEDEEARQRARDLLRRHITDEEFTPGRPRISKGDAYSGNRSYGDPDGR